MVHRKSKFNNVVISKVLSEYTQPKKAKIFKKGSHPDSYLVIIDGETFRINSEEIQEKLYQAGYATIATSPCHFTFISSKHHKRKVRIHKTMRNLNEHWNHDDIICLEVATPKLPVSPPPFHDPNGRPPKKTQKKKE